jgi:hypothetical protein
MSGIDQRAGNDQRVREDGKVISFMRPVDNTLDLPWQQKRTLRSARAI